MKFRNNWREFTLIALGILIILVPFVIGGTLFGWANVVLGGAVIVVGAWPLITKKREIVIGE